MVRETADGVIALTVSRDCNVTRVVEEFGGRPTPPASDTSAASVWPHVLRITHSGFPSVV
jgi:hypothetical protein